MSGHQEGDRFYLEYIDRRIQAIDRSGVAERGPDALAADPDATLYRLQTLCESTQRLSADLKADHPEIPWKAIAGFRNAMAHEFQRIDHDTVLGVVQKDLPALGRVVNHELAVAKERDRTEDIGLGL